MDLDALRAQVYLVAGIETTDGLITSTVVNSFINQALQRISTEHDWPWNSETETLTTTANVNYVTPAATWLRTRSLTVDSVQQAVEPMVIGDYDMLPTAVVSTVPEVYCEHEGLLLLWPVPSGAFTLKHRFTKMEPSLSSGTDTPLIPSTYQYAIVEYAVFLALQRARNSERAEEARQRWQDWMVVMKDNRRRHAGPMLPRQRPGAFI